MLIAGCGGQPYPLAPVAGQVTFKGQPLAQAHVLFQPVGEPNAENVGPPSVGHTDDQGRFTLRTVDRDSAGAVVGKHRVFITLPKEEQINSASGGSADGGGLQNKVYTLPKRFRDGSGLEYDVPPEGASNAEFALTAS
jgi:hypothetical protein